MTLSEKYRIVRRLGDQQKRKFSDVFLVEDKATGEEGVLKILRKTAGNAALQERLRAEAGFGFDHPSLPRTLFRFESETELAVVRSYTGGVPLGEFLKKVKTREKSTVLLAFLRALEPVFAALDREKIVHLDLKPSNFIVRAAPDGLHVALIDFGMALRTDCPENRGTLFPLGYAAPELLLNRLHLVDRRTDLFALGIVLWQQLTGRLPLVHPNPSITTNLQLTHPLPADDAIPSALFAILEKLCAKHAFTVPPNRLPEAQLDACLREGMARRYDRFADVVADWENALKAGKRWRLFR